MVLSLAAGSVLDADPLQAIAVAAAAGFDSCGLRLDPDRVSPVMVRAFRSSLNDLGVSLLDLEVIRLNRNDGPETHRPLLELAAQLGAPWVLTVVEVVDQTQQVDLLGRLDEMATELDLRISLEFMAFTAVCNFADALRLRAAVPRCRVLVDMLHLARTGGTVSDVAQNLDALSYVQLCDAPPGPPGDGSAAAMAHEARHHRLLPGDGDLDVRGLARVSVDAVPISIEVQSDTMSLSMSPLERAIAAFRSARAVLAEE